MYPAVVIMSKVPQPGFSKTRLNSVLSEQESADFHRACLADTGQTVRQTGLPGYIYYIKPDGNPSEGLTGAIWGLSEHDMHYFKMKPQHGADLGQRMYNAAREVLTHHEAVIFLGCDTPQVTPETIMEAREKIFTSEIIIGPSHDGGYYLLGIKHAFPFIFDNIPWGTPRVLDMTLQKLIRNNLSHYLLPPQRDIDTWEDLNSFYYTGQNENRSFYQGLEAYRKADELVRKYSLEK